MRKLHTPGIYRALLLAGCATTFALAAAPAMAQDDEDETSTSSTKDTIVVTGSRIARPDYVSNSPTVSVDQEFLQQSSTAAVEQQLNKLPQFVISQSSTASNGESGLLPAGGDIQPNATNTPGAATVSLRGVGANRTLVLIDGRRGVPGNASGTVDVSTIPNSALQRVEVISGGASATYGADAVAGVTNFILKKDFQGIELDGQMGFDQRGHGFEYQVGGIIGTDLPDGRGNVSLAMSMNTRETMLYKDNPWYRDLWNNPNTTSGAFFFVPRPGISGLAFPANGTTPGTGCEVLPQGCVVTNMFPGANPPVRNNTGSVFVNEDGSLFIGNSSFAGSYADRGGGAFFKPWPTRDAETGAIWSTKANGRLYAYNALTPQTVPTTRYNFLARGNFEVNDWIGVFGQGMFSNSTTYTVQEAGGAQGGWDVNIPWGNGTYTGAVANPLAFLGRPAYQNPAVMSSVLADGVTTNPLFQAAYPFLNCVGYTTGTGGCTNTEAFQQVVPQQIQALLNQRTNPNAPFSLSGFFPNPRANYSEVTTYMLVAGLEGSVPGTDWTWEAFVNHGQSQTWSRQTGMYSMQRVRAVFTAPNFGQGFNHASNEYSGEFGAARATCTTGLNFFGGYQGISDDCREAIAADNVNRGTSRQTIVETNLQGGLFDLPAGQLRFAVGASYRESRYEFIPDTAASAGRNSLDSLIGIYPGTKMEMQGIDAKELYGELLIPVVRDLPFIQELNLEVGGRMSHYNTTGTSYTFKVLGDWQVTDWLRFRGGFNRAERMPNIAELLLTPQQSFGTEVIGDVCSTRHNNPLSANPNTNTTNALDVQAMCLALMQRDNGGVYVPITDENSYYYAPESTNRQPAGGGGFTFATAVGNQYYREHIDANYTPLKSEIADTWTAGAVIQSPMRNGPLSRLNLAIDYFNIKIKDPISRLGEGAQFLRCVSPDFNPAAAGVAAGATSADDLDSPEIRARALAALAAGGTCASVFRNPSTGQGFTGQVNSPKMIGSYGNDGEIRLSGIDANLSWSMDAGPGTVFANLNANYMIDFKVKAMEGQPFVDYVGTTGTTALGVNSGSSFEYRIFGTLGYNWGPANLSMQWQYIPKTEDGAEAMFLNGLAPAGTAATGLPAYSVFHLNGGYQVNETVRLRFGIDNVFNIKPPLTNMNADYDAALGQLPGGGYSLFHDVQGRRFSLGANVRF
ncbi:MAG: TonB-dependent receptor [Altererythrobacter sp.]|nr:TonB-dependent receptor [Altererythrobacter sp.]